MDKKNSFFYKFRLLIQLSSTAITNGYFKGFLTGKIFEGSSKYICTPGLNCYSCPGALGSCPIGSLQAVLTNREYNFSLYVLGFLFLFGVILGRFICGFLCPFGLIQDLLYKIPFIKKIKILPGEKILKYFRFLFLFVFVIILPMFISDFLGNGEPWFCKYICPVGTLEASIPLIILNNTFRTAIGFLYKFKFTILLTIVILSVFLYRPFCRYICPLGAIYGLFNKVSFFRFEINTEKCLNCGICKNECKLDIDISKNPNSMDCIRCGDCIKKCPVNAINLTKIKDN